MRCSVPALINPMVWNESEDGEGFQEDSPSPAERGKCRSKQSGSSFIFTKKEGNLNWGLEGNEVYIMYFISVIGFEVRVWCKPGL